MENQSTYRIRTKLGETEPINIPVSLMQEYNSFEILSLKMNVDENYNSYTSTEGIVVGRVSTANNGLGIPNVRVSIFVPKGQYSQTDEEAVLYPFSSPNDKDGDRIRYNLLPSESDVDCYQVIGTLPTKRKILDNETVCEVFEKYYKYTTVTNESGDFMLTNIPVGKQRIHIDADLSDIGPFLSQRPYDMIENLGFDKNKFDSTRQFKTSEDLDSLAQVISQTKSLYVYPYWGDVTEHSSELKITRTDLSLNYEFKTNAIFIGSIITDKQSNSIRQNCTATNNAGKMSDMVTGPGRIEMIRKTVDDKVEQFRIKGDELINDNGVWCYMIPMNLDYVRTDEYGNIIPTDDPNKGVPTRARVRFRITLTQMDSDEDAHKRCSYLVPNNPKITDEKYLKENEADYSFGSDTWEESFVDLFWNKVYSVKNYVPQIQKTTRPSNRKHTGIKMTNHYGDNNPFPYNGLSIKLTFTFRLICVITKVIIGIISGINIMLSIIGALPCYIANIKIFKWRPFKFVSKFVPGCIELSSEFCDDGVNKNIYYPNCGACLWKNEAWPSCEKAQAKAAAKGEEAAVCTNKTSELMTCIENELAQQNECTSFNFSNDWINGCLYMPLWYRHIKPKKSFFFGLFKRKAKDQWCSSDDHFESVKLAKFCAHSNSGSVVSKDYKGNAVTYRNTKKSDSCGKTCNNTKSTISINNGVIVNTENMYGQKLWYYKSIETTASKTNYPSEYVNSDGQAMTSKLLFATDIILLGSMNDCDTNGVPKFFNYLKASTFNLPTDILFSDTEFQFTSDENGNWVSTSTQKISVSSGCDWGNKNEYGYYDGGLFYSIGCSTIEVDTTSCINLRRICELGVGLDEMQYVENIDTNINSNSDELDFNNLDYYLRPDGFISYDDIIDFNYRSMFATMNGNYLKTKMNTTTGVKEYDFRHLYIDNFDGSLKEIMQNKQSGESKANYNKNHNLENASKDYLTFRMGETPYYYDGKNLSDAGGYDESNARYSFPKYKNSFYFYFGLKEGKTAIDLFNEQYNGPCYTKSDIDETIDYTKQINSWCCVDSDNKNTYDHSTFDGYLTLNLEDITLPCSIVLNSKDNANVTYTVCKLNDVNDTNVTDGNICFRGDNSKTLDNYVRYGLIYENSSINVGTKSDLCYMLNNGEYTLYITDGDGNQHSYAINLKNKYLEFDDAERSFAQPNNVLLKYYKTTGGKYSSISYNSVAKSPETNEITIELDENSVPVVGRIDKDKKLIVGSEQDNGDVKLNGTICVYNVYYNNSKLNDFIIEVEPYDKDNDDNYVDEDFWKSETQKNKTWYSAKRVIIGGVDKGSGTITEEKGKKYVKIGNGEKAYICTKTYEGNDYYIIKCPKGGVDYRVTVTQLCEENGKYFKSSNYFEKKINVSEPTPYKLYINDVDYDVIKNFNSGYVLSTDKKLQTLQADQHGTTPFKNFGTGVENSNFNNIKGWLNISNIQNKYYDWTVDEKKYGPSSLNIYDSYGIDNLRSEVEELEIKLENMEPSDEQYDEINNWYESKSTILKYLDNRLEFIDTMKTAFWIQCENDEKSITYSVRTDDTPYQVWTVYNEEEVSSSDEDYNETKSEAGNKDRTRWYCKGESVSTISGIKIPTITSYDSSNFGIENDATRQKMKQTYNYEPNKYDTNNYDTNTMCFAQDNIAENSKDTGSISIKPPYLVACVNKEGITKPDNLKVNKFFAKTENEYGVETYEFGANSEGYLRYVSGNKNYEFFGFHLVDKIFAPNIVCWSYINNVPYYMPWLDYDKEPSDNYPLGYAINVVGILSGVINNGVSSSTDTKTGCVNDFEEANIFSTKTPIKNYTGDTEDSIPTRRCILYDGNLKETKDEKIMVVKEDFTDGAIEFYVNDNISYDIYNKLSEENKEKCSAKYNLSYTNYRHTTKVDNVDQYKTVSNRQGTLSFSDGSCDTTRDLYGSMRVRALSTSTSTTLGVSCTNGDTNKDIKYYIFQATQRRNLKGAQYDNNICWYPLNAFKPTTKDDKVTYTLDCKCTGDDETQWVWDGSEDKAQHIFNKNTNESIFRDPNHFTDKKNGERDLAVNSIKSQISYVDEEGETKYTDTYGYGTTGLFTNLNRMPYFVVAVTEGNTRAISPVYDFHPVYYIAGLISSGENYYLRVGLVRVLRAKGFNTVNDEDIDKSWTYGIKSYKEFNGYCKKPRNYYLTQYDFTMDYNFTDGSTNVTSGDVPYTKENLDFIENGTNIRDLGNIGKYYSEYDTANKTYTLYTNSGGGLIQGEETPWPESGVPTGTLIAFPIGVSTIECYYIKYSGEKNDDGTYKKEYQLAEISSEGEVTLYDTQDTVPTGYLFIGSLDTSDMQYYVTYTTTVHDEDTGKDEEKKYYVPITYSLLITETGLNYNPRLPYFMRTNDKSLTKDEYKTIKSSFKKYMLLGRSKYLKLNVYVTDVTGLKHTCECMTIINENSISGWNRYMTPPE